MAKVGYSNTPLAKKLGIKKGDNVMLISEPEYYFSLFTDWPEFVSLNVNGSQNVIHLFVKEASLLYKQLPKLKNRIVANGMIWVSWPKKASKEETDITEDVIRREALSIGLVDVKVCAIDNVWSGLKLVIPVKDRM